ARRRGMPHEGRGALPMAPRARAPTLRATKRSERSRDMRRIFEIGGLIAAVVLIAFGIAAIVMGVNGRSTVNSSLKQEQITGTPDMTPQAIAGEVTSAKDAQTKLIAKLRGAGATVTPSPIETPTCSVAGK